jgi:ribonuclease HI
MEETNDYLKITFDGAFFQQTRTGGGGGWAFIIRDNERDHVGSGAGHIATVFEATHAEALTCLNAIQFASGVGIYSNYIDITH